LDNYICISIDEEWTSEKKIKIGKSLQKFFLSNRKESYLSKTFQLTICDKLWCTANENGRNRPSCHDNWTHKGQYAHWAGECNSVLAKETSENIITCLIVCHRVWKMCSLTRTQTRNPGITVPWLYGLSYPTAYTSSPLNSEQFWTVTYSLAILKFVLDFLRVTEHVN
jgi:hypothetical protein